MKDEELNMEENNVANTTKMTLNNALEICKQRISIDRRMRENTPRAVQ